MKLTDIFLKLNWLLTWNAPTRERKGEAGASPNPGMCQRGKGRVKLELHPTQGCANEGKEGEAGASPNPGMRQRSTHLGTRSSCFEHYIKTDNPNFKAEQ